MCVLPKNVGEELHESGSLLTRNCFLFATTFLVQSAKEELLKGGQLFAYLQMRLHVSSGMP